MRPCGVRIFGRINHPVVQLLQRKLSDSGAKGLEGFMLWSEYDTKQIEQDIIAFGQHSSKTLQGGNRSYFRTIPCRASREKVRTTRSTTLFTAAAACSTATIAPWLRIFSSSCKVKKMIPRFGSEVPASLHALQFLQSVVRKFVGFSDYPLQISFELWNGL